MEFLRFGSRIPGSYWGCCAADIAQNFKVDPDAKASIQLVHGDSGTALMNGKGGMYLGPTWRDIFKARIRISTFNTSDKPNRAIFAILESSQLTKGSVGWKWLQILKEEGFEFIRAVDNSVYSGSEIGGGMSPRPNYIFGLFRNIGGAQIKDPFKAPQQWLDLDDPYEGKTAYNTPTDEFCKIVDDYQRKRWIANTPTVTMSEEELLAAGAPIFRAGQQNSSMQPMDITAEVQKRINTPKPASPFAAS